MTIHFLFALLAGFVVWKKWRQPLVAFSAAIAGGFLIDLDHFFDYVFAFAFDFNLEYFSNGYYNLRNGKIFYLLHGWEYVAIFAIIGFLIKKSMRWKSFFLALALGMFFHLSVDVLINEGMRKEGYFLTYRAYNKFNIEKIVSESGYQKYLFKKQELGF